MDMGRLLTETHLRTGRPPKELARSHDVSASWLFALQRRFRLEAPARREPVLEATQDLSQPTQTLQYRLAERYRRPRSVSTIHRRHPAQYFSNTADTCAS